MARNKERKKKKKSFLKRLLIVLCSIVIFAGAVLGVLQVGVWYAASSWEYWQPSYEKQDITGILSKTELSDEDYETLYRQTGLTKLGIDGLLKQNFSKRILDIQDALFARYPIKAHHFNPFTYMDVHDSNVVIPMAALEDGDIIVTATTRVSWWRYGHAALVIDGRNERIIESIGPGSNSEINHANCFSDFSSFMILRPKVDAEIKEQVADFAEENLINLPYQFTVGIFTDKFEEDIKTSQCAHLVWYAYKKFGIDLDATGGAIVKPQDMANSDQVEVVQAYGYNLDTLWA